MTFLSRKPAWFMASYAMPPVMAPSPITAMQLFFRPCRHQAAVSQQWKSMGGAIVSYFELVWTQQCHQRPGKPVFAQGRCNPILDEFGPCSPSLCTQSSSHLQHAPCTTSSPCKPYLEQHRP